MKDTGHRIATNNFKQTSLFLDLKDKLHEIYPGLADDGTPWCDIVNNAELMSLPANAVLLNPDTPCSQFMILIDGCVRVYQQTPNDREVTLYRNHSGDLCTLTLKGLIHKNNFGAFAQSETDITVLSFSRQQFMQAMAVSESFREYIVSGLTSRFQNALDLVEETVFNNLDTRLVCYLAQLARENGTDRLYVTHQEIAREFGTAREVISRLLKTLERQGCIELSRGEIRIILNKKGVGDN